MADAPNNTKPQSPTVQTSPVPTPPSSPEAPKANQPDPAAQRLAALQQQERKIQQERTRLKQIEQQLADKYKKVQEFEKAPRPSSPIEALQKAGFSYEDAVNFMLNEGKATPDIKVKQLEQRIADFEAQVKAAQDLEAKRQAEREQASSRQAEIDYLDSLKEYLSVNKDRFELAHINDAGNLAFEYVKRQFNDTGKVIGMDKAFDYVEKFLEAQVRKNLASKKFKETSPASSGQSKSDVSSATPRTLNNRMAAPTTPTTTARSEEERIERAKQLIRDMRAKAVQQR